MLLLNLFVRRGDMLWLGLMWRRSKLFGIFVLVFRMWSLWSLENWILCFLEVLVIFFMEWICSRVVLFLKRI